MAEVEKKEVAEVKEASLFSEETTETGETAEKNPAEKPAEDGTTEAAAEGTTEKPAEGAEENPPTEKDNHDNRRWKRLLRERAEAQAEAAAYKAIVEGRQPQGQQQQPPEKPVRASFQSDEQFYEALTDWKVDQKMGQVQQRIQQQSAQQTAQDSFRVRETEVKKTLYPDYDERIAENANIPIPQECVDVIYGSTVGPDICYHLATHPEIAEALNRMPPKRALVEIGKLEAAIETDLSAERKPAARPVSKAPAPIPKVAGVATESKVDESKLTDSQWFQRRQQQRMQRNTAMLQGR